MKLKEGFILHTVENESMAIASGEVAESFNGIVRINSTATYIFELLQNETTEDAIVAAMCERYDADPECIKKDVHNLIEQFRNAGFLHE